MEEASLGSVPVQPAAKSAIWNNVAILVWSIALVAIALRIFLLPHRGTSFSTYETAGLAWRVGQPVYTSTIGMGFVYSPALAAFFALVSFLPSLLGKVVWLLTNAGFLLWGMMSIFRANLFPGLPRSKYGLVMLLTLPLAIASMDVAQANSAVIGLLMLSIAAAYRERWGICALAIAVATFTKIYPLALGLVLCVFAPRQFTWRLLLALTALLACSLLWQHPHYVVTQYHDWIATRLADNRRVYSMRHAPLDLWFLLVRLGHLPISERAYSALQMTSGVAIALLCHLTGWWGWSKSRRLAAIFILCCIWMTLLGPATESYTYVLLVPAISLGLFSAFALNMNIWLRLVASAAFSLLLAAQIRSSFFPSSGGDYLLGARPLAAFLFLVYSVFWISKDRCREV